jgi:multidrug efflux pump subunit AcrA (membrane-fusion protein)
MMKKNVFVLTLVAAALIFTSCGKLPQAEIDAAKNALEQAKTVQADLYLQADFYALQDSLNATVVAIEEQKSKMFGNYKMATEKLNEITVQATDLVAKTETRKEEIKTEVASAQLAISALIEENNQMLEMAPKGKEGKEALEAIKADVDGISTSVSEIPVLIENGDLLNAQTKVKAAQEKAVEINTELKTVLEKSMKKS